MPGVITGLIQMKNEQTAKAEETAIGALSSIVQNDKLNPEYRKWANNHMRDFINLSLGGKSTGGGGSPSAMASTGGSKGAGHKPGIGDIFHGVINKIIDANPYTPSRPVREAQKATRSDMPSGPVQMSDEDYRAQQNKIAEEQEQIKMRANIREAAIKAQMTAQQNEEIFNTENKRALAAGLTPQQAYERASSLADNKTPPDILRDTAKKPSAGKNATIIGPDGKEFIGVSRQMEDGSTQLFKIGSTTPLDPATYSEKVKEPQDVSSLRGYEEDLKTLKDPSADPTKKEAAKLDLRDRANKNQATVVRIEREQQQNKTDNAPANPDATNFWSGVLAAGGHIDYGQWRTMGKRQQADIMAKVPQLAAAAGMNPGQFLAQQSDVKALQGSLSNMEKQYATVSSFEKTAQQNLDRAINAAKQITDTGSPFINKPWREAEKTLFGQPQYAAFHAARITAFTEVSKVLNGALGNGAVSDSARKEAEGALSESATLGQLQAAADILKQDMESRTSNMKTTIDSLKGQIGGGYKPPLVPGGGKKTAQQEADEFLKSLPQ